MSDSSQRAAQRRRIQQLHERLELYNFADSSADPASTAASGPSFAGGRGLQAGLGGRAPAAAATKPSRAAPVFSSPDPTAPPPATTNAPEVFSVSSSHQTQPAGTGTSTAAAAGRTDWLRASQAPLQPRATMAAPAPAPQLARNLAHEFGGTSASPTRASPPPPPPPPPAAAFGSPTTGLGRGPSAPAPPATAAAASAAGGAAGASRRASDVFRYFEGGESDDSEYMEYDVEEVEEYTDEEEEEEEEEEESDAEGDGESDVVGAEEDAEHVRDAHTRSLEQMLHRLYRACSTSPHHAAKSPPSPAAAPAAAAALPARDRSVGSAAPPRAASVGATADTANLFLQQAAEVYRQRHRYRAPHAPSPHDSPHSSRDAWTTGEESSEADTSTSEPTEELDDGATSRSCSSAAAAPAATTLVEGAAETTPAGAAAGAAALESLPTAANAAGDGDGLPSAAVCFDQLETAYRRLLVLQQGVLYVSERAGPKSFPAPLPHQEEACALAQQRDAAARRDAELRAAPPSGATLEDLRQRESAAVDESLAALYVRFTAATSSLTRVTHRESLVEGKRRLLKQRELEVAKQREARLIIERDCAETERRHSERAEQLQRMEAGYSARLQQHDQQQKAAQEQIGEVEQLSKQVSAWLGILEERDRRLGRKESRLQRVQDDLLRRTEDVTMWKKATQRVKQIPPPPSPPRIR